MIESHEIKECTVDKTGHCALHGIEVERRQNTQEELKEYKAHTASLLSFKNTMIGVSILGGTVLFGGIIYTYNHIKESDERAARMQAELSTLRSDYARTDERYIAVTSQLGQLNGRISQLVEILLESKQTRKVEAMKDE